MPSLGDFFRFGLGAGFVTAWDAWLQERLAAARQRLGPDWQPRYFAAPIWRFTLAPGLAGPDGMAGILMPSVDRVGRHFPLTVAAVAPPGRLPAQLHFAADAAFAALEEIALRTLDGRVRVADLESQLALVTLPLPAPVALGESRGRLALVCGRGEVAAALAAERVACLRATSVWSCLGADDSRFVALDGLPGPDEALALFDPTAPLWSRPAETVA